MAYDIDLLGYLPEYLRAYAEFKEIAKIDTPEFEVLWKEVESFSENLSIITANETGLSRWERILQLRPGINDTLEERRFRILSRVAESILYTYRRLETILTSLCGEGEFTIERKLHEYAIKVRIAMTAASAYASVEVLLEEIVPLNMIIDLSLLYEQHKQLNQYTHNQLSQYTHNDIRNEVMS